jgi:DNA (cytosine-5)-methyltransferase 1
MLAGIADPVARVLDYLPAADTSLAMSGVKVSYLTYPGWNVEVQRLSGLQDDLFGSLAAPTQASVFTELCEELGVCTTEYWCDAFGVALRRSIEIGDHRPIRALSLFSGAGGLDIGFHDAGFDIQASVEIDARFAESLKRNSAEGGYLAGTTVHCEDIRGFDPSIYEGIEFIIGGPPCQTFSAAGRRAAGVQGTQDARGTLFQEYVRILKALSPKAFLFENVYGITGAEKGRAWEEIRRSFADAGYKISFCVLDAADYGVPQHRERMFIVGAKDVLFKFPLPTHGPDSPGRLAHVSAASATRGIDLTVAEKNSRIGGRFGYLLNDIPEGLNYSFYTEKLGHPKPIFAWRSKFSDFLYKADPNVPIRTLKAQGGQYTGPFHWENRPFSVNELRRLQTFPDNFQIVGNRQVAVHQLGNSVPPQLARILAIAVRQQVFGMSMSVTLPHLRSQTDLGFRQRKRSLTAIYREKAERAFPKTTPRAANFSVREEYFGSLGNDFRWEVSPVETESAIPVRITRDTSKWEIFVGGTVNAKLPAQEFEVLVTKSPTSDWGLGNARVILKGVGLMPNLFVAAWKAFERELFVSGVKADIVQLCEYYQYPPRFNCRLVLQADVPHKWHILKNVVEGIGTRAILHERELSLLWNCDSSSILDHMLWLRTLAFEVRNTNTNPQIPDGHYLIPYSFPTLNPHSVQIRKSLVARHG